MVFVLDNYDSFTYNLVQYLGELGAEVMVKRNDETTVDEIRALKPERIVLSPGPGRPEDAGVMMDVIRELGAEIPIFGVCLGHQAIGAVFGALLTMYTAVATRAREIATLRALGFNPVAVLVSVFTESIALAAIGGLIGGLAAYAGFNGYQTSTINFQTFSQVAFAFRVTPSLLVMGLAWSLAMGFIGALLPALRAARLPISQALREL